MEARERTALCHMSSGTSLAPREQSIIIFNNLVPEAM